MQENLLARYTILHELGRGATGAIYAARDRSTGATVSLKRLDPALLDADPGLAARFLKQARSARRLKHPNLAAVHESGEAAGTAYAAIELLEGESLRKLLDKGPLPLARALQIARDIASGLAHAHLEGVVHGALDASSIVVLRSGAAKIADFGIGGADHRDDVFSLGVLLYEMLAHRPPFAGGSPKEILQNAARGAPPPSELNPLVPRALDAMVRSMLAAQPAARMPGIPVFLRELERLEEALGIGSKAGASPAEPARSRAPAAPPPGVRDADELRIRPEPWAAEALQDDGRISDREVFDHRRAMMERESSGERSFGARPALLAALALALGAVAYLAFLYYPPGRGEPGIVASPTRAEPPASRPSVSVLPPVAEAPREPANAPAAPAAPPAPPPRAAADPPAQQASPGVPPAQDALPPKPLAPEPGPLAQSEAPDDATERAGAAPPKLPRATRAPESVPKRQPGGMAQVVFVVSPAGDIYIDGKHHGTTPPITTVPLEPGMHRIEIRSGSRKPYLTYMTVHAGEVRRIRHDFNARPSRPPA